MPELAVGLDARGARTGAGQFNRAAKSITLQARTVDRAVMRTGSRIRRFGASIKAAFSGLRGLGVGITAAFAFGKTARTLASFEDTMVTVGAVTRATGEEFAMLEGAARRMGATTRFTASEAGEGLLFLGRAGFEATDAVGALPGVLNLAQVGMLGLGEAADIASNVVSAFQLSAEKTTEVANTMVVVSNRSNTSVQQLAEAMKFAAPVSSAFGESVASTSAAIGVLGDSGIQASLAGTNLRGILAGLTDVSSDGATALQRMGLSLNDVNPENHDLVDIFEKFAKAQISASEATALFGRRNVAAALVLSRSTDKMRDLEKATMEYRDEADRIAKLQNQTLTGQWKALKSAIDEMTLSTGDKGLTGTLKGFLSTATETVRILAGVEGATDNANQTARDWADTLAQVGSVAKFIFGALGTGFNVVMLGFRGFKLAIEKVLSSILTAGAKVLEFFGSSEWAQSLRELSDDLDNAAAVDEQKFRNQLDEVLRNLDRPDLANFGEKAGTRIGEAMGESLTKELDEKLDAWINDSDAFYQRNREAFDKFWAAQNLARLGPTEALGHSAAGAERMRISNVTNRMGGANALGLSDLVRLDPRFNPENTSGLQQMLSDLQTEINLVGKTADERERLLAVREFEQELRERELPFVKELTEQYDAQYRVFQDLAKAHEARVAAERQAVLEQQQQQREFDQLGRTAANAFRDIITGATDAVSALKRMGQALADLILQKTVLDQIATGVSNIIAGAFGSTPFVEPAPLGAGAGTGRVGFPGMSLASGAVLSGTSYLTGMSGGTVRAGEKPPGEGLFPLTRDTHGNLAIRAVRDRESAQPVVHKTVNITVQANDPGAFGSSRRQLAQHARSILDSI